MSDTLYIKPDKEKTYSINSEEEFNYYRSLRPSSKWDRIHFKCKCSKCHEDKDILLLNLKFPFICFKCKAKIVGNKESTKERRKATCLAKYGVENPFQSEEIKDKIKETCLERYGTEHANQSDIIKEKTKQNCLEKYGVESTNQLESVKQKKKETCLEKYGVTNYLKTNKCKEQIKETCLKKYGVVSHNQIESVKEKKANTFLEHYGATSYFQSEEGKAHNKQVKLERYGDEYYSGEKKYLYEDILFRSKPELCFYIYHKNNNIPIVYEPTPYIEYEYEGKQHFYKPDFLVNEKLYEIKGDQFFKENKMVCPFDHNLDGLYEAKHQCMLKNNVTILKYKDYTFYVNYINEKYGNDYLNQFKIKKEG